METLSNVCLPPMSLPGLDFNTCYRSRLRQMIRTCYRYGVFAERAQWGLKIWCLRPCFKVVTL